MSGYPFIALFAIYFFPLVFAFSIQPGRCLIFPHENTAYAIGLSWQGLVPQWQRPLSVLKQNRSSSCSWNSPKWSRQAADGGAVLHCQDDWDT